MGAGHVVELMLSRFRERGSSQVSGYNSFGYVKETPTAVIVRRENGEDARVPFAKLEVGVQAVRHDPRVYDGGPTKLRAYGITHITSPIWSLLHLVSLDEILGKAQETAS